MKKATILFTLLILWSNFSLIAQNRQNSIRKIKALKVNYITTELNLSPAEAEKFWPIYNEYEKSKRGIRMKESQKIRTEIKSYESLKNIPEKKAIELQNQYFEIEEKYIENKKRYFERLIKAVGVHKVLKLHLTEQGFNATLLKQFKNKKKSMQ